MNAYTYAFMRENDLRLVKYYMPYRLELFILSYRLMLKMKIRSKFMNLKGKNLNSPMVLF